MTSLATSSSVDVTSNGASSSASLNSTIRVSKRLKVAKKLYDPSDYNVPSKRRRGRRVGSLYKSSIMNRVTKAGLHMSDAEGAPLSQSSLPVDPFLKPHELDRAPSKLAEDLSMDPSIPDITNWTSDDVFEYFTKYLPEAASILKEQEYDGKALSTARRADIVRGLGLPLGPALALYRIIVKLQTRKDDWTMCWG